MVDATASTVRPVWSDTRVKRQELCQASASNASIANDEEIYTSAVPIH
jgi:hypothetical protein